MEEKIPEVEAVEEEISIPASPPALVSVLRKTREKAREELAQKIGEAVEVAKEMAERLKNHNIRGFIFQKMVDGVEMFIGVAEDPSFGPLITCGAGGIFVELFKDVSVRVTPITRSEAYEMVTSLKSFPMLTGYRGRKKANVDAFVEAILRINALIEDFPEIVELDCNPVIVHESADAVDVRIRLRT